MQKWERTYLNFIYRQFNAVYKHPQGKVVLTYADGPSGEVTEKVVNVLKEWNITAYFFLLGNNFPNKKDELLLYKENGQFVGLHGKNHIPVNMEKSWQEDYIKTLNEMRNTGLEVKYTRPPYGLFNKKYLQFLEQNNLQLLMWNHTTYDYKHSNAKKWAETVSSQIKKGDILLMHDSPKTADLYPDGIRFLLDNLEKKKIEIGALPEARRV
ncbi:MAG: polysaccharide deacetylase family protein [Calditrichia bacterium]|nr:polysaccharide deacetylase family protein [Calditrichia bacterium]